MFGGYNWKQGWMNDVYIIDLSTMGQVIKAGMKFPKRNETKQTEVLPRMHILWYVLSLSVAV